MTLIVVPADSALKMVIGITTQIMVNARIKTNERVKRNKGFRTTIYI